MTARRCGHDIRKRVGRKINQFILATREVDLRRTLTYANHRSKTFFGLSSDQGIHLVDRKQIEKILALAFDTISDNNVQFLSSVEIDGKKLELRLEEYYNKHQEIVGLLLIMWFPGEGA